MNRLEQVVQVIAEDQVSLQKLIAELATETRKGFDRVAEQFAAADRRMSRAEERLSRDEDRMRKTDERIEKLVSGIGEFMQRQQPPRA